MQDEENTVPCSLMLTDEKIYVCHDEQDNALIRQLDSVKLDYVTKLLVDPQCQYYCVLVSRTDVLDAAHSLSFYSRLNTVSKVAKRGYSTFYSSER